MTNILHSTNLIVIKYLCIKSVLSLFTSLYRDFAKKIVINVTKSGKKGLMGKILQLRYEPILIKKIFYHFLF